MTQQAATSHILLAEDNAADEALVREALHEHGVACTLHVVKDGEKAIAFIRDIDTRPGHNDKTRPHLDLLLLDMHLPRYDGPEILHALRSTEHYAQKPVIVMTSSASPGLREATDGQGAMHYFRKPSSLDEFLLLGGIVKAVLASRTPRYGDAA